MSDEDRMAEDAEAAVRDVAVKASDRVQELGNKASETIRDSTDKATQTAKEGLKVVQDRIADMDFRETLTRRPWITLGVAFAVGMVAGQITWRPSR